MKRGVALSWMATSKFNTIHYQGVMEGNSEKGTSSSSATVIVIVRKISSFVTMKRYTRGLLLLIAMLLSLDKAAANWW